MDKHDNISFNGAELLSFDEFLDILNGCNSKMEQYLQIHFKIKKIFILFFESYMFEGVKSKIGVLGIEEVKQMLNYKDLRSVLNWCNSNEVVVINQGSNKSVNKNQFLMAFYKPLIAQLKSKHADWQDKFKAIINGDFSILIDDKEPKSITAYKPKSQAEKDFLSKMQGL